jgi:dUTPase
VNSNQIINFVQGQSLSITHQNEATAAAIDVRAALRTSGAVKSVSYQLIIPTGVRVFLLAPVRMSA